MLSSSQYAGPLTALFAPKAPAGAHSGGGSRTEREDRPSTGLAALLAASASSATRTDKSASAGTRSLPFHSSAPPLPKDWAPVERTALLRSIRQLLGPDNDKQDMNTRSFGSLYDACRTLIVHADAGQDIFDGLKGALQRAVGARASSLRAASSDPKPEAAFAWLDSLAATWQDWCDRIELVRSVLSPLDQNYLLPRKPSGVEPIRDLAMRTFKESIVEDAELQQRLLTAVTLAINTERQTDTANHRDRHAAVLEMLLRLDSYSPLEAAIHESTSEFYQKEASALTESLDVAKYLGYVSQRLSQEEERANALLHGSAGQVKNVSVVLARLVSDHSLLLVAGFPALLQANDVASLARLYALLSRVSGLADLKTAWATELRASGQSMVLDSSIDDTLIERILQYKARTDNIVKEAFGADSEFTHRQQEAFESFINARGNRVAELIAKFLDVKLKQGNKTMTDAELEEALDDALVLFRYTHDKDMFEEFYKRSFAKRLLLNRSASSDAEQSMLLKLKDECGAAFTNKLETMLKDITLSEDIMKGYEMGEARAKADGREVSFDFSAHVLTQAHWPTYPQSELIIPSDMAAVLERFKAYYQSRNSGRRLTWAHSLGTCALKANLPRAGEKELHVSTYQSLVMLLFNDEERLRYEQIKERVGLDDKELRRTLQSLACGQIPTRVLRKDPQGKDVNDGDCFVVNPALKNERQRVRINQIQMADTVEEQSSTRDRVMFDRNMIVDAAVVRILKAKKQIRHAELITEVVDATKSRFAPDIREIKNRIETLIDREYLERVEGERGLYRYVA
ncbi:ubiquitin-protein cullin 4 [Ceraceosorus bombacis]|uniref:Ubiquitin-protein cullin 4 n=1 Tax=Ceraceosorus bombacis TaxID=401625 RepID=A0A0P1BDD0_9BASI|nr:ubiquitin-protein cullin 4 [Ceraceosorus bombacis]